MTIDYSSTSGGPDQTAAEPGEQSSTAPVSGPPKVHSRPNAFRSAVDAVDERMGLGALDYPVPEHANNLAWSLGGLTAVALGVLIVTGVLLTQFYVPDPAAANDSIRTIMNSVTLGAFVRNVHFWAAQAMYLLAGLHLIRVFITASYKRPREGNWLIGASMFALTFLAIFSGTVLKWDQEGYEALGHNVETGALIGGAGFWFSPSFSQATSLLDRLYSAHVVLIPGLILVLLFVHVLLIKRHKISPHPLLAATADGQAPADEPTEPFTFHLRRVAAFGLVLVGILMLLALVLPQALGTPPVEGVEITKPPWLFWAFFTIENLVGLQGILWGGVVFFGLIFLVPFVDRNPERHPSRRKIALTLGGLVLVTYLVLTVLMVVVPAKSHLGGM